MAAKKNKVGKVGKQNSRSGQHPSYKKRKMSKESIAKKRAYDKAFSAKPEQKKKRADCNKKRREAIKAGKNIKGKDYDHAVGRFVKTSTNRGRKEKSRLKKK